MEVDPAAVDPDDLEMLQDMIIAAVNEGLRKVDEMVMQEMQKVTGGLKLPPGLFCCGGGSVLSGLHCKFNRSTAKAAGSRAEDSTAPGLLYFDLAPDEVVQMARALVNAKDKTHYCRICGNFTDDEQCVICTDQRRDPSLLCVVQDARDVLALERMREFRGRYHVLGSDFSYRRHRSEAADT